MTARNTKTKARALVVASRMRKMGFNANVFEKKKGYGVSVTRNMKKKR